MALNFKKIKVKRNFWLLLPFGLLTILLVIVPLIMVFITSFLPTSAGGVDQNWSVVNSFIWIKILKSIGIAIVTTIFCILIGFPFAYFLAFSQSKTFKALVITIITAPVWTSFLVKLVGLKTFLDFCYGYQNATYGDIFTIIGLTYIYIPFMILPLYSVLNDMPKNLIFASKDLGRTGLQTFFNIVIPYCKGALMSGVTLVLMPCITTVGASEFLNNSNNGALIGSIIVEEGQTALESDIAKARTATICLVLSLIMLLIYFLLWAIPKLIRKVKR